MTYNETACWIWSW